MSTEEHQEQLIQIEIKLGKIFHPKGVSHVESGEFAIFIANVVSRLHGTKYDEDTIKLKGNVCELEYGVTYKVYCTFSNSHPIYGDTYEITFINRKADFSTMESQRRFLEQVLPCQTVDNLFAEYNDVLTLMEERNIEALCKVRGVGVSRAMKLCDKYEDTKDLGNIYIELGDIGLSHTFIKKMVAYYNSPDAVIQRLKEDPYSICKVITGVGFKTADEIAIKMGLNPHDDRRIKGFMIHWLTEEGEAGRSWSYHEKLTGALYDTLGTVPDEVLRKAAKELIEDKTIIAFDHGNRVALTSFYKLEQKICYELIRLRDAESSVTATKDVDEIISMGINGFEFTDEQEEAIRIGMRSNVIAITGPGGSGKTSVAKGIVSLFQGSAIMQMCLAGKAAVRIGEVTGLPSSTIHRGLGWTPMGFTYNKHEPLPVDIVLLDEATMVNGRLMYDLLSAIPSGSKVILMGDVSQLQSLGCCDVYGDILKSDVIDTVRLTKIHRQAQRSGILRDSLGIARQERIVEKNFIGSYTTGELKDMEYVLVDTKNTILIDKVTDCFIKQYERYQDDMEVQVLTPMRIRSTTSCYEINKRLQQICNPFTIGKTIEVVLQGVKSNEKKSYIIKQGDKVICTKNNYQCKTADGKVQPIFNGSMGRVLEIFDDSSCLIEFIGFGTLLFSKDEVKTLEHAWSISIHKSQGSQFKSVIVALDTSSYVLNTNEILYTGVSRAIEYCTLISSSYLISQMIERKESRKSQTFLCELLKKAR